MFRGVAALVAAGGALACVAGVTLPWPGANAAALQDAQTLMAGIAQDVAAIFESFAGGPADPHSPVYDRAALETAADHLDAATRKAQELADELDKLRGSADP